MTTHPCCAAFCPSSPRPSSTASSSLSSVWRRSGFRWPAAAGQLWPAEQAAAVRAFPARLVGAHCFTAPDPAVPAYEVLTLCAEATGTLGPWLQSGNIAAVSVADRHLAEAVAHWERDLLGDQLPWETWTWEDGRGRDAHRTDQLARSPCPLTPLRAHGAPEHLLHRLRLLGLTGDARWDDPHWPGHTY